MALVRMRGVSIAFGGPALLAQVDLQIERGERVCLLGRNGTGKSTLMRLIHGDLAADDGELQRQAGVRVSHLAQEVPRELGGTIFTVVTGGLKELGELLVRYQQLSSRVVEEDGTALNDLARTLLDDYQYTTNSGEQGSCRRDWKRRGRASCPPRSIRHAVRCWACWCSARP